MTVGEWLDIWLAEYVRPHLRPKTYDSYESVIRLHVKPAIGGVRLRSLQTTHVQHMVNGIASSGLSARMAGLTQVVLHAALKQATMNGMVPRNVAEGARKPKTEKHPPRVLTPEEQAALMEAAANDRLYPMVVTMLGTGLRIGEAVALRWDDVDLRQRRIQVRQSATRAHTPAGETRTALIVQSPKTAAGRRSVALPPAIVATLQQWHRQQLEERLRMGKTWRDSGLVFTTSVGTMIGPRNFARKLTSLAARAGIENVNPHALRHTYATRALEAGVPAREVQESLGHTTITMTLDVYSHVLPEMKQAAADAIDKFLQPPKGRSSQIVVKST
ncbi:MAG: tyrosine-type recombinase/integrase [Chloroflexota bacterium]